MATFTRSDELRGAEFVGTDLRGARFTGADLSRVVMRAVDVQGAEIDAPWLFDGEGSRSGRAASPWCATSSSPSRQTNWP
jgi:hypothetical protein